MRVKCRLCENDKLKRKVVKRVPVVEIELPEEDSDYKEFMCMNIIKELRKDKKWHENVCTNRMIVLNKK